MTPSDGFQQLNRDIAELEAELAAEPQNVELLESLSVCLFDRAMVTSDIEDELPNSPDFARMLKLLDELPDERSPWLRAVLAREAEDFAASRRYAVRYGERVIESVRASGEDVPSVDLFGFVITPFAGMDCLNELASLWTQHLPDRASSKVLAALAAEERGDPAALYVLCREAKAIDSDYWFADWLLTTRHFTRAEFDEANAALISILARDESWHELVQCELEYAVSVAAWLKDYAGEHDDAAQLWQQCADLDPSSPSYRLNLALSLELAGGREAALSVLEALERDGALGQVTKLHKIRLLRDLGRRSEASSFAMKLTIQCPSGSSIRKGRSRDATSARARACIHAYGFPTDLDAYVEMAVKRRHDRVWINDVDEVLGRDCKDESPTFDASAPKWITADDAYLFYHTKSALPRAQKLLKDAVREPGIPRKVIQLLEHAVVTAEVYAGTIFGWGRVCGSPSVGDSQGLHFGSRIFVDLDLGGAFQCPLPYDLMKLHTDIKSASTITALDPTAFNGLRAELAQRNSLPDYLAAFEFAEVGFSDVNSRNWSTIVCQPGVTFVHEIQVRSYLLDHFLKTLKDEGSPLLEECRCYRLDKFTGIADYFVKVDGTWIPVEAKISMAAELDILGQVKQYLNVDVVEPTVKQQKGTRYSVNRPRVALIGDQTGIFVVAEGELIDCAPGRPLIPRSAMGTAESIHGLRGRLAKLAGSTAQ